MYQLICQTTNEAALHFLASAIIVIAMSIFPVIVWLLTIKTQMEIVKDPKEIPSVLELKENQLAHVLFMAICATILIGISKEIYDTLTTGFNFIDSFSDILFDISGIAFAIGFIVTLDVAVEKFLIHKYSKSGDADEKS